MAIEKTLSIIKPDAVRRALSGKINARFEEVGLKIMVVCMFGSSLAVAPAFVIAQSGVNYVNIEVPKAMAKDRENSIVCKNHLVYPPKPELWG